MSNENVSLKIKREYFSSPKLVLYVESSAECICQNHNYLTQIDKLFYILFYFLLNPVE